jgi:hypothetical protein
MGSLIVLVNKRADWNVPVSYIKYMSPCSACGFSTKKTSKVNTILKVVIFKPGLDINVCPVPDSQTCRYDGHIYFHWYKILDLLYKRVLFYLQFVHNLFWLKLKWNARSKLFLLNHLSFSMLWWSSRTSTKLKLQSQKRFNERKYQYLKYKNKNHSGTDT